MVENLLKDGTDGCALAALIHFYCPGVVRLEGKCVPGIYFWTVDRWQKYLNQQDFITNEGFFLKKIMYNSEKKLRTFCLVAIIYKYMFAKQVYVIVYLYRQ